MWIIWISLRLTHITHISTTAFICVCIYITIIFAFYNLHLSPCQRAILQTLPQLLTKSRNFLMKLKHTAGSYKCQYKKCHILSNKYAQQLFKFYEALTLKYMAIIFLLLHNSSVNDKIFLLS